MLGSRYENPSRHGNKVLNMIFTKNSSEGWKKKLGEAQHRINLFEKKVRLNY